MKLDLLDKEDFLACFLQPIAKVTDSGILKVSSSGITTTTTAADSTIIVSGTYTQQFPTVSETTYLNVPDLKKLVKLITLIPSPATINIDNNSISHSSQHTRFKYHLYEDGIIVTPALNMSKLAKLNFDTVFTIHAQSLNNLMKGSALNNTELSKVYISTNSGDVVAEITDKSQANVDSFATTIATGFVGAGIPTPIPINFEILRLLTTSKIPTYTVKHASSNNIFNFELKSTTSQINYIVSALASI